MGIWELAGYGLLCLASWLLGGVPTAYIVGRLAKGVDLRDYGSGNVGASNLYRQAGKRWVPLMVLADGFIKGAVPVLLVWLALGVAWSSALVIGPPLLAVAGNNWSPFLRLQGGRGLMVAAGSLIVFSPPVLAVSLLTALIGWKVFKSSGLWVLIALALLPLWLYWQQGHLSLVWYALGLLGLVVLKRLLSNWTPFPEGLSRRKVLLNRLVRDRDVDDREQWIERAPSGLS